MKLSYLKILPAGAFKGILSRWHMATLRGQYPTFLLLAVTERCNCRCSMCHIWKKKDVADLSLEDYDHIFSDPLWRKIRILSLTGGEPFLRRDLADLILLASKRLPRLERVSLPSNGLLTELTLETTHSILEKLPRHIYFKIGISIDGPEEIHDRMRGVPGAFKKAVETVRRLKKLHHPNFGVGILSLFTEQNIDDIQAAQSIFEDLTDQITWTLSTQAEFFGNLEKGNEPYSKKAMGQILAFIDKILIPRFPEKAYLYSKYRDHLLKKRRTYPCLAGYRSAYVDIKGNLLPCHYLNESYSFGNFIKEKRSLERAWFSEEARELRQRLAHTVYCRNCSNNCDSRNLVHEDFWNFFAFLLAHPAIPIKALFKKREK